MKRLVFCLVAVVFLSVGCTSRLINVPAPVPHGSGTPSIEPDLIKAYGVDGTLGYVRSADLNGVMPKTPEEALAQQRSSAGAVRQIPLYAADGKTVIGVFNVH